MPIYSIPSVREIDTARESMDPVFRLTHDVYVSEGYADPRPDGRLRHYPSFDGVSETHVYVAMDANNEIAGTCSLTVDSPAGLPIDGFFADHVEDIRERYRLCGQKIAAYWRFVTTPQFRGNLEIVLRLLTISDQIVRDENVGALLLTVNPRHVSFYQRMAGLIPVGDVHGASAVKGAPAVLMAGDVTEVRAAWELVKSRRTSARLKTIAAA